MNEPEGIRRSRLMRRLILLALAIAAFALIQLRSETERVKAEEVCVDGVAAFESGVTGSKVECR